MSQVVFDIINRFTPISQDEYAMHIVPRLQLSIFKKGDTFINNGQYNRRLGILKSGLFRSYYYDDNGDEITTAFIEKESFFTDLNSYQTSNPSERTIKALERSLLYILTNDNLTAIRASVKNWTIFEKMYYEKILRDKINFQRKLTISTKKEAFQLFIETYPQAAKYAPRQHIASFLGMTPYTLSRIKL